MPTSETQETVPEPQDQPTPQRPAETTTPADVPTEPPPAAFVAPEPNANLLGALSLVLMGMASFFIVIAYLGQSAEPAAHTAAAAESIRLPALDIRAKSAIVIDVRTGDVLFEKNADAQLPLASLTKVPLALAVSEVLDPDSIITIPYDTGFTEGAQRLLAGERLAVKDVLHFTLIASSNEGAQILAEAADERLFALYPSSTPQSAALWRMNDLAKSLDLNSMYFLNVSGLDESASQSGAYGSARDVAKLFAYAATARPDVFAGTTRDDLLIRDMAGQTTTAFNTNEALGDIPGLIMGKTGYTDLAGGNLAVVFDVGISRPVAVVVLGSTYEGRFSDMKTLVSATLDAITSSAE